MAGGAGVVHRTDGDRRQTEPIDRIAERAAADKRLLYVYFGDKDAVFEAVLR